MKTHKHGSFAILLLFTLLIAPFASARPLRGDEEARFLPGLAALGQTSGTLYVEGRTHHLQRDSWSRYLLLKTLRLTLGLSVGPDESAIFEGRGALFLATRVPGVDLYADLPGGNRLYLERSDDSGYFSAMVSLPRTELREGMHEFAHTGRDGRSFPGKFLALHERGLSVISDIDDTVKVTGVKQKSELLQNTFLRPFRAIPGMASLYQELASRGASFHYVSSSPSQLAPVLEQFFADESFPATYSLHLRPVDIDPLDFADYPKLADLFSGSESVKVGRLETILKMFPQRSFVLVGDSTEEDPETYARLFGKYGDRIRAVWIRDISGETEDSPRYRKLFPGKARGVLKVYSDPESLRAHLP